MSEKGKILENPEIFLLDNNLQQHVDLSLVIPAYNEEKRLPIMISDTLNVFFFFYTIHYHQYFEETTQIEKGLELVIIDDGSSDKT